MAGRCSGWRRCVVISGDADLVDRWCDLWEAEQVFVRRVNTTVASHSSHMDPS